MPCCQSYVKAPGPVIVLAPTTIRSAMQRRCRVSMNHVLCFNMTTSVAQRFTLWALCEEVPGLIPGRTNLGNELNGCSPGCSGCLIPYVRPGNWYYLAHYYYYY